MAEESWDDAELWFGELLRTATELEGMLDEADPRPHRGTPWGFEPSPGTKRCKK